MKSLFTTVSALALLSATSAHAVPIAPGSELSITGADTFNSTSITFTGLGAVVGSSGSFTSLPNCSSCVTLIGTLDAATAGVLYTATSGGNTATQSMTPPNGVAFNPGTPGVSLPSLTISGTGSISLSGFDTTPGQWEVTTQGPTSADVSFSATSVTTGGGGVNEPGTLAIIGAGLIGFAGMRRWRNRGHRGNHGRFSLA